MSPGIARSSSPSGEGATAIEPALLRAHRHARRRVPWGALLTFTAGVAYPILVYWVVARQQPSLGLVLPLVALVGLCLCLPHRRTRVAAILGVLALAAAAIAFASPSSLFFLPPLAVNLGLAGFFGRTLASGREALITRFARLEQDDPEASVVAYTRRLTLVWVVFFLVMAAVSAFLALLGAHWAWVWFTAVGNYLCVAALFAIEYWYRRWRFPRTDYVSPRQQIMMVRAALRDRGR